MTTEHPHVRWTVDPSAELLWRSWGEAHFAFDPRSGQTHFLNSLATEIYHLLDSSGRTVDDVYRVLLDRHAVDEDDALRDAIETTLNVLDRLGVVLARHPGDQS